MNRIIIGLVMLSALFSQHGVNYVVDQIQQKSAWHAYGGFVDSTVVIAIDAGVWTHITNATDNIIAAYEIDGFTITDDTLIVNNTADFIGSIAFAGTGGNSKVFFFRAYNVTQDGASPGFPVVGKGADAVTLTMPNYFEATTGDRLILQVMSADGSDFTLNDILFTIMYVHD